MGTDIHTMAEVLVTPTKWDGERHAEQAPVWKGVKRDVFEDPYYRSDQPTDPFKSWGNRPMTSEPYRGRNYELFAFLADVRNGTGFAGIDTGERIVPLDEPRGVPEDASKAWRRYVAGWGSDLHSTNYFTLTELLAVKWDRPMIKRGVLDETEFLRIKATGYKEKPQSWSGAVTGQGLRTVSVEEYDHGVRGERGTYVRYQWEQSLMDFAGVFVEVTIPGLLRLAPFVGPHPGWDAIRANGGVDPRPRNTDAVRFVFGFDN